MLTLHGEGLDSFDASLHTTKCRIGDALVDAVGRGRGTILCPVPHASQVVVGVGVDAWGDPDPNPGAGLRPDPDDCGDSSAGAADGAANGTTNGTSNSTANATANATASGGQPIEEGGAAGGRPRAPAGTGRTVGVYLTLNDQQYVHAGEVLLVHYSLTEVRPAGGPVGGGTLVTVRGFGFDGAVLPSSAGSSPLLGARCLFRFVPPSDRGAYLAGEGASGYVAGGSDGLGAPWPDAWRAVMPVLSRDHHALRCVTPRAPPGFTGRVDVLVTLNGVDYVPELNGSASPVDAPPAYDAIGGPSPAGASGGGGAPTYRYYALRFGGLTPRGGPAHGGTTVVVSGAGFADYGRLEEVLCRFGEAAGGLVVRAGPHPSPLTPALQPSPDPHPHPHPHPTPHA